MFKEWEDYIIAAAVVYGAVVVGAAAYETHKATSRMDRESSSNWDTWTNSRYKEVTTRLNVCNASLDAMREAYKHCHMLINRHIAFYENNPVAREAALAYNDRYLAGFNITPN